MNTQLVLLSIETPAMNYVKADKRNNCQFKIREAAGRERLEIQGWTVTFTGNMWDLRQDCVGIFKYCKHLYCSCELMIRLGEIEVLYRILQHVLLSFKRVCYEKWSWRKNREDK